MRTMFAILDESPDVNGSIKCYVVRPRLRGEHFVATLRDRIAEALE